MTSGTLDQARARSALARHQAYPQPAEPHFACPGFWGDYSATANGLPPAIRSNGLILALATEVARASGKLEPGQTAMLADLCAYLSEWSRRSAPSWLPNVQASVTWPKLPGGEEAAGTELRKWQDSVVEAAQRMLEALIALDESRYQVIGEEALAYLAWLKTLAKPKEKAEKKGSEEAEAAEPAATGKRGDLPEGSRSHE